MKILSTFGALMVLIATVKADNVGLRRYLQRRRGGRGAGNDGRGGNRGEGGGGGGGGNRGNNGGSDQRGNGGENGSGGGNGGGSGNGNGGGGTNPVAFPTDGPTQVPTAVVVPNDPLIRIPVDGNLNNLRFNKVLFEGNNVFMEANKENLLPLLPHDFPLSAVNNAATVALLRQSQSWSVIAEDDCKQCQISFTDLIQSIGGLPTHPTTNNPNSSYWDELREVIEVRRLRLFGSNPADVLPQVPAVWTGYSLNDMADAVHNEYPGKNQAELIETFIRLRVPLDPDIVPSVNAVDFLRYEILLAELNTWAISMVGPSNFGLKFSGGRARPEEIVWFLKNAQANRAAELATWGVPNDILNAIANMDLSHPYDFTAYDEGSPTHPSWPAMHSAASVASFWLAMILDLSKEQRCEAMALDYGVSYGRTIAGVHFPSDNTAGLNLGQEMLVRSLPAFLREKFGADVTDAAQYEQTIRNKIANIEHDWVNYSIGECFQ